MPLITDLSKVMIGGTKIYVFRIAPEITVKKVGEKLSTDSYEFEFLNYPSEMNLWAVC